MTEKEQELLQAALMEYRSCPGYTRTFRNKLRHNGSFLGRDFKQLVQILPVVLKSVFKEDVKFKAIIDSFAALGQLSFLLHIRGVKKGVSLYLDQADNACRNLVRVIHELDISRQNSSKATSVISCMPKLHILTHLKKDILRFGYPLHYETENGEQYNKFIREHLFMSNRQNTSRDVAIHFGKQMVLRHLSDGGFWWAGEELYCMNKKVSDMKNDPVFVKHFFGGREHGEYDTSSVKLKNGLAGIFKVAGQEKLIVGILEQADFERNYFDLNIYHSMANTSGGSSRLFPSPIECINDNIVVDSVGKISLTSDQIQLVEALDLNTLLPDDRRLLNISKFGSLFTILSESNKTNNLRGFEAMATNK